MQQRKFVDIRISKAKPKIRKLLGLRLKTVFVALCAAVAALVLIRA